MKPVPRFVMLPVVAAQSASPSASGPTSEIQQLREAAFGRYKNVLCVICNEWICSRNRFVFPESDSINYLNIPERITSKLI